jgi:hypothetical protein
MDCPCRITFDRLVDGRIDEDTLRFDRCYIHGDKYAADIRVAIERDNARITEQATEIASLHQRIEGLEFRLQTKEALIRAITYLPKQEEGDTLGC